MWTAMSSDSWRHSLVPTADKEVRLFHHTLFFLASNTAQYSIPLAHSFQHGSTTLLHHNAHTFVNVRLFLGPHWHLLLEDGSQKLASLLPRDSARAWQYAGCQSPPSHFTSVLKGLSQCMGHTKTQSYNNILLYIYISSTSSILRHFCALLP